MNVTSMSAPNYRAVKISVAEHKELGQSIKLSISFEPLQLTWLTSRELISDRFSKCAERNITSIEVTQRLLNCPDFMKSAKDAYDYCMKYPSHIYFGVFPLQCVVNQPNAEWTFRAKAHEYYEGHFAREVEIEINTNQEDFFVSKDYAKMVTVRFNEGYKGLSKVLSSRERDVLGLLGKGYTVKRAAGELFLSTHTIESHKQNIYKKLKINSMAELGRFAERLFL